MKTVYPQMSLGSQSGSVEVYGCVPLNAGMMLAGKPGKVTMDLTLTIADVTRRYLTLKKVSPCLRIIMGINWCDIIRIGSTAAKRVSTAQFVPVLVNVNMQSAFDINFDGKTK